MQITNVMAMSLDGRIGVHDREGDLERQQLGLSGDADQSYLRLQIETCDSIIVGASSIRANGQCLDHPGITGRPPAWCILARSAIPHQSKFWQQTHIPRIIVSPAPLPMYGDRVENWCFGDADPAAWLKNRLVIAGYSNGLLFGGGIVNRYFYNAGLVDRLKLTISPIIIGRESASHFIAPPVDPMVKLRLLSSHTAESFVFLDYAIIRNR